MQNYYSRAQYRLSHDLERLVYKQFRGLFSVQLSITGNNDLKKFHLLCLAKSITEAASLVKGQIGKNDEEIIGLDIYSM